MARLRRHNSRVTPRKRPPAVESLEDRRLLAFIGETIPTPTFIEPAEGNHQRFHFGNEAYEMIWEPIVPGPIIPRTAQADEPQEAIEEMIADEAFEEGALPILHSLPEATTKVFLDFDGNFEVSWGSNENIVTPAYDFDGNPDSFSMQEQGRIAEIWRRVAEDYSPFNIDVTTEDPSDAATLLQEVDSSNKRVRSFYFRRDFDLSDPNEVQDLQVQLLRDDGAAVYLNGTEVVRDNLGENAQFDDFATAGASGSDEQTYHRFNIDATLLLPGRNVVAVEVHQRSDDSSDVSFDMRLAGTVSGARNSSIIEEQSSWRYLDDGSNPGTLWRTPTFDDSSWQVGAGEFGYGDVVATTHVAIGGSSSDWFGGGAGGVAFVNGFSSTGRTVAYVFPRSVGDSAKNVAEASSHEAGHTFGLLHQSIFDEDTGEELNEYNSGEGDWAPIMGVSYDRTLSTWHRGPTNSVNSSQDDMNTIGRSSNGFGYRTDQHGNTITRAASLSDFQDEGGYFSVKGILERTSDRDAFTFTLDESQSGVSLAVTGIGIGQNLDAVLELRDANNQILVSDDPLASLNASIDARLAPGTYTAIVQSNGDYGRVGQYTLRGHIDEKTAFVGTFDRSEPLGIAAFAKTVHGTIDFENDSDTFIVAGQLGQSLTAIVTPQNPAAVLSVQSSAIAQPIVARRPGEAVRIPASLLNDTETTIAVTSSVVSDYAIDLGINHEFEFNADRARGSSDAKPVNIDGSRPVDTVQWSATGQSGDGTDTQTVLVSRGVTWRYLDDGSNQRTAWRAADFDDTAWLEGAGHFGYGDGDETVVLQEDRLSGGRIRTFYFRHTFHVDDADSINDLTLRLLRDDGAAVYLNGTEIRRDNLSSSAGYTTFANKADVEDAFIASLVNTDLLVDHLLVDGVNVLAVEVHQSSDTSSDVSFEFELLANAMATESELDVYEFTLSEDIVGNDFDIALFSEHDFANETFELHGPTGELIATATSTNGDASLAIFDVKLDTVGTYRIRLNSDTQGEYQIAITAEVWPEYKLGPSGLPVTSPNQPAAGYLDDTDLDDSFELIVREPRDVTFSIDLPFHASDRSTLNDLQTSLAIFNEGGGLVTASGNAQFTTPLGAGTYRVDMYQLAGSGEYLLNVTMDNPPPRGDLNADNVVDTLDIDYLCSAIRVADVALDQNGDGKMDSDDLAAFVLGTLNSTFGDVNLDGKFNSGDLVLIFQVGEYEDLVSGNSTWAEGDWNCDGDFNTSDLIAAFQTGDYSAAAIAEAPASVAGNVQASDFAGTWLETTAAEQILKSKFAWMNKGDSGSTVSAMRSRGLGDVALVETVFAELKTTAQLPDGTRDLAHIDESTATRLDE